eukprot:CAMPEP_0178993582 /NCGR_PEP_ID=MMETSP0795-20121207/6783_1 /TAXON_ID=88552 /ORGANISM="Amoebophrya sp., Strain Ameob2" /LENGTH=372 /DNA_ID=CAMNT_0020685657 /DNA_START=57 /DNA_END=1175 /DNA_ORIENTATION=+
MPAPDSGARHLTTTAASLHMAQRRHYADMNFQASKSPASTYRLSAAARHRADSAARHSPMNKNSMIANAAEEDDHEGEHGDHDGPPGLPALLEARHSGPRMNDYSDVLTGLTGSQGSISLVTALLAGFNFAGLSGVSREEYEQAPAWAAFVFPVVTGISIALSLYTSICCAILEQQGRIAKALAVARGEHTMAREKYEKALEEWYGEFKFRTWRTNLVWMFMYGSPSFALSIGLMCLIKMPRLQGYLCLCVFAGLGVALLTTLLWLNRPFRSKVLCIANAKTHAAPRVSNMSDEVLALEVLEAERRKSDLVFIGTEQQDEGVGKNYDLDVEGVGDRDRGRDGDRHVVQLPRTGGGLAVHHAEVHNDMEVRST